MRKKITKEQTEFFVEDIDEFIQNIDKENIVEFIENIDEVRKHSSAHSFMEKFPTSFWIMRLELKAIDKRMKDNDLKPKFVDSSLLRTVTKRENMKRTKRNLRRFLENEFREKRIFFYVGEPHTTNVYRNPIIQTFFEFSLFYSFVRKIELTANRAKRMFIELSKVSLGFPSKTDEQTQIFDDFLQFSQGDSFYFNSEILPDFKVGRKGMYAKAVKMADEEFTLSDIAKQYVEDKEKKRLKDMKDEYLKNGESEEEAKKSINKEKESLCKDYELKIRKALEYRDYRISNGRAIKIKS